MTLIMWLLFLKIYFSSSPSENTIFSNPGKTSSKPSIKSCLNHHSYISHYRIINTKIRSLILHFHILFLVYIWNSLSQIKGYFNYREGKRKGKNSITILVSGIQHSNCYGKKTMINKIKYINSFQGYEVAQLLLSYLNLKFWKSYRIRVYLIM